MHSSGGLRSEWKCRLAQLWRCRVVWVLAALILGSHVVVAAAGQMDWIYETFALSRSGLRSGYLWQLGSHALVHGGWLHLGLNLMLLVTVGSRLEYACGAASLLRVGCLGVLAGGLMHLATSDQLLAGASGGVLAMILCYCSLSPESRVMIPLRVSAKSLGRGLVIAEICLWVIDPQYRLPGLAAAGRWLGEHGLASVFQISHACHLGGAAVGWLYARWLLRHRVTRESLLRDRARREGGSH